MVSLIKRNVSLFRCCIVIFLGILTVITYFQNRHINTAYRRIFEIKSNRLFQTTIECIGESYHQSCLYRNLYFVNETFMILTVNDTEWPSFYDVRTNAFAFSSTKPKKHEFKNYVDLENFVRQIARPKIIPSLTVFFGQYWHYNIGHALFDGLYPAFVALIRFAPRHLQPFRILGDLAECKNCWSEDVYRRFAGLGLIKFNIFKKMSRNQWFLFDELVMGSGTLCQRCTQPNFQLYGGIALNGSRLFRDRMYRQHGLIPSIVQHRSRNRTLNALIIHNKRFTKTDTKAIEEAMKEINQSKFPLINVTYIYYDRIEAQTSNVTSLPEFIDNNFIAQLKLIQQMDIHISGPGTGQMYQTFLSDGAVHINIGGLRGDKNASYTSYMEQYVTSGTPYIKGLYYPMNERAKGIEKTEVIRLIQQAAQMIINGFDLPVDPYENLAVDGKLFIEMCQRDREFCSMVTTRTSNFPFICVHLWLEDFVHEYRQWSIDGYREKGKTIKCSFNHTLLRELRNKYEILWP